MYNTIIFDLDGTLIDSSSGIKSAVKKVIDKFNLKSLTDEDLDLFISTSPIQKAFINFCQVDEKTAQKCADEYRKNYISDDLYNAKVYDGVIDLLEYLKKQNYKMGIASYKRQDTLDAILSYFKLDKYFSSICGADNKNKFTKKDILEQCIKSLNVNPEKTIFVGDSMSDGIAAKELGCCFFAVSYGYGFKTKADFMSCNALLAAQYVSDIKCFIMR